jgi:hypothetical protein
MNKILSVLLVSVCFFSGCASGPPPKAALQITRTAFKAPSAIPAEKISVDVIDVRNESSLDAILNDSSSNQIRGAILNSLNDSGLFSQSDGAGTHFLIRAEIVKLQWFVPGYEAMLKKVFVTSFLTGGLGGVAYGSTETEVHGICELVIKVDANGRQVLCSSYAEQHIEKMVKLKCDTMDTKSRVAGIAVSRALDKALPEISKAVLGATQVAAK